MKFEVFPFKKDLYFRFLNTSLRAVTLGSRFILFFFLARFLNPDEIGYYGLFSATLLFCILLIGLDFYTFSQREILSTAVSKHSEIVLRQAMFHLISYAFLLPLTGLVFVFDFIPQRFLFWFYLLLPLEHIAQELGRILIAMGQPLIAGFILFLKTGFWTWIGILGILYFQDLRKLEFIFLLWSIGCFLSIAFALYIINKQVHEWRIPKWDWGWAQKGVKTGMFFLMSSLTFRALTTFDKYIVNFFSGADTLGVYVFFASISASLMTFMDAGVFVFLYPSVVESFQKKQWSNFGKAVHKLIRDTIVVTIILTALSLVLVPYLTDLLGKDAYTEKLSIFWLLLAATSMRSLSMIPHYTLYAFGKDRAILYSQLTGVITFIFGCFLMPKSFNELIVPISLSLSFICIFTTKTCFSVSHWNKLRIKKI